MFKRIDHVEIVTDQLDQTVQFYTEVLGFTVKARDRIGCRRDLCWNLIGAVSDRMRIRGQAARSIGLSASFWVRLCHPSTLRMVI